MNNPFLNDPFSMVWAAFKNLFPDRECECWFDAVDDPDDENGHYGWTQFNDDGTVIVAVDMNLRLADATEIFAHELAHVAAGEGVGHGKAWADAFDAIFDEYNRLGYEMFDAHASVDALDGKKCVIPAEEKKEAERDG